MAGMNLLPISVLAADEDVFLEQIQPQLEQTMGQGKTALWTMPLVATQYQPVRPTPAMQAALQAQREGRFLDALIQLDEADKSGQANVDTRSEISLIRASFLLQGNQSQQAITVLTTVLANDQHAADAYALTAMAFLQLGKMREALEAARHARGLQDGILPHLVLSYALQGVGQLVEARDVMHDFNDRAPQLAVALAREAELVLALGQAQTARTLEDQALGIDIAQPYVIAVNGLIYLIDGHAEEAKSAFETALRRNPKDAKALLGLGLAEIKLGNLQEGQQKLLAANEAYPDNALILTYLGRAQWQSGQTAAAMASWHSAQLADPKDPEPWLYQAQAELQANHPLDARESLQQAQARTLYRNVYRGENLIREDEQLLQANLAESQHQLGLDSLAFQTLSTTVGEKNAANLRNQADVLQGQRFGESARRSLLLQSLFNDRPGNLPPELDIYGDGAGQTGAQIPQHGEVTGLHATQASYNNYDELFSRRTTLALDAMAGSQNSGGQQARLGVGNDTLGIGLALRQFKTDGHAPFTHMDNRVGQGVVQWQPEKSTEAFVSYQTFDSQHGETRWPADPYYWGEYDQIDDDSSVTRLGLRRSLSDNSEFRGLFSHQQTRQTVDWEWISDVSLFPFPEGNNYGSSAAHSVELQYRRNGTGYAAQWGVSSARSPLSGTSFSSTLTNIAQQIYVDWQQTLNPYWQLETGLAQGRNDKDWSVGSTSLRRWLPKLGMVYTPDSLTHVRFAAWKAMDDGAVGNASLAPVTLAGIVLNRTGDTYKLVQGVALGADRQLDAAWLLEGQVQGRWTDEPVSASGVQDLTRKQVNESRLALHWQPGSHTVNVTLAYDEEHLRNDPVSLSPDSVQEQHLRSQQLGLRWFASSQWTANLAWSHNRVAAIQQSSDAGFNPILLDVGERFNQTDASLSWQFTRMGSMDVGVRNATNRSFQYTDIDPLIPRFSMGRLWYGRLKFAW
jgi:Tfp pilus assembly protein PilF